MKHKPSTTKSKNMKFISILNLLIFVLFFTSGCSTSITKIGTLNMISHRNVDPSLDYRLVSSYSGGNEKELKKSRAENLEDAIEQMVKKVPGGEFLMNVKVYEIKDKYFAVEGDVWGKADNVSYRGFTLGDRVVCKDKKLLKKLDLKNDIVYGTISGLIDDVEVYVKLDDIDRTIRLPYDKITKSY